MRFAVLNETLRRRDANRKGFLMLQFSVQLLIDFAYCCEIIIGPFICGNHLG